MPNDPQTTQPSKEAVEYCNNLLWILADIREKSGVGIKPMLSELANAIAERITTAEERGAERMREMAAKFVETHVVYPYSKAPVQLLTKRKPSFRKHDKQPRHHYADAIRNLPTKKETP